MIFSNIIISQEYFYYYDGNKMPLELNTRFMYISADIAEELPDIANVRYINVDTINESYLNPFRTAHNSQIRHNANVDFEDDLSKERYFETIYSLMNNGNVIVSPSFDINGENLFMSEYFYVCLNQLSDTTLLIEKANETNVRIVAQDQFMENWFILAVTEDSQLNSLETANLYYESGVFRCAEPDFWTDNPQSSDDPYYPQQWGLKNTGQYEGVVGMDINVEPAWDYSTGEDIIVAVIDGGIKLDHPDLQDNVYHLSYDAEDDTSPSNIYDDHGTMCAGVIGAVKDNNNGVSGIAPNCKIMSVSFEMNKIHYKKKLSTGINWAWENGADILSNSYSIYFQSDYIDDAIDNAVTNGRNGLGCVVLCSSGNDNKSLVNYPASLSNTIAVGAMSPCGERKHYNSCDGEDWGSNYGAGLDVVAPGVLIPTTTIYGDYELSFSGTSAACPHAAGVMALVLSANPCLTQREAKSILCRSCDKLPEYSYSEQEYGLWNNEVGYGKINAYKAIELATMVEIPHDVITDNYSKQADIDRFILSGSFPDLPSGTYFQVERYEIKRTISFPYTIDPNIEVYTDCYSGANPNDGRNYYLVSKLTNTSATIKTWCYYIKYNASGQLIDKYSPAHPSSVYLDVNVKELGMDRMIFNQQLASDVYEYSALRNITADNLSVTGSAIVKLRAGESVLIQDGTYISPDTTGYFEACIEPFNPCSLDGNRNGNTKPDQEDVSDNYEDNNIVIEDEMIFTSPESNPSQISIYPNPANDNITIELTADYNSIEIYDSFGRKVNGQQSTVNSQQVIDVDISNYPSGLYLVVVKNDTDRYYKRIVKN